MNNKQRFNVEEHTTLDNKIIDVFPISHRYIHDLEQQVKKQKEVIDKVMSLIKEYGKYDGKTCTRSFLMYSEEFNKILYILNGVLE